MNPQITPGQPVAPAPSTVNTAGVAAQAPTAPAVPTQLPQGQPVGAPMAPPQNPNTSANLQPALQDIANYYQIPQQASLAAGQTQAQGTQAGQQYGRTVAQNELQTTNLQNSLDPSKYTMNQNAKSQYGISITNSLGQQVSLQDYVNLTGSNPATVLANSTNPQAQQFVTAYNNLENFMQTTLQASGGSEQAKIQLADYYSANPGLENMTPQQVTNAFMSQYGEFFGQPQQSQPGSQQGVSSTFQSAQSPAASSPYYEMQLYPQTATANPIATSLLGNSNGSTAVSGLQDQLNQMLASNTGT